MRADPHRWLRDCPDEQIVALAGSPPADSKIEAAGFVYAMIAGPGLLFGLVQRAVERSSWFDIITWLVLFAPCIPLFLRYRHHDAQHDLWIASLQERERRQLS